MASEMLDPEEPRSLAEAIGSVVLAHLRLELNVRQLFMSLTFGPAVVIAGGQQVGWLLDQITAMAPVVSNVLTEKTRKRLDRAIQEARQANAERNRTVHDQWLPAPGGTGDFQRMRSKRGQLHLAVTTRTLQDLADIRQMTNTASVMIFNAGWAIQREVLHAGPMGEESTEDDFWAAYGL